MRGAARRQDPSPAPGRDGAEHRAPGKPLGLSCASQGEQTYEEAL